ncbi:MAG: class I SAM-dependent methyltransferase [Paludibacter sp.]|nr:class I SAM-dependent methyltransferase [Paludibacter sp.]
MFVNENQFGTGEKFTYFKCAECGCLQIAEFPEDMVKYYPKDKYYSYNLKTKRNTKIQKMIKRVLRYCYFQNLIPKGFKYFKFFSFFQAFEGLKISTSAAILDVGCGSGWLLEQMAAFGYKNLTGIEPFNENDIINDDLSIWKTDICNYKTDKKYDVIMFNHSFEHIAEQHETLSATYNLLTDNGYLIISIPVCDCFAFRKYGRNWRSWDAPRHFFLHSTDSIMRLNKKHNLSLIRQYYDSSEMQFIDSEDIGHYGARYKFIPVSSKRRRILKKQSKILNEIADGDTACFIFQKKR